MEKKFKILLVDDRKENLIALEDMLAESHREFITATSGNEALRIALKQPDIGLIMLDVQMPEMDGFEVATILKGNKKTRDVSIVFVTAISKEEEFMLKGFTHGAVDYLHKPLNIGLTRAKVNVFEKLHFFQEELKNAIAQKEEVNKQLERFSFMVAHDLKSPLAGINGLLSVLTEDERITGEEDLNEYMQLLIKATSHLGNMITTLLEHSRNSTAAAPAEPVDVKELLEDLVKLLFLPPHIDVKIAEPLPVIHTTRLKLEQVFQNLIANAVKHNDKPHGVLEIGCEPNGEFYRFYVKDNGPGIEEADQQRIFRLFEKSDGEDNTGVGLNIAKIYVEEQGGKITVESRLGEGSCFFFDWKTTQPPAKDIY